jgi:hypothetical protein
MKRIKLFENFQDIDSICQKFGITNWSVNTDGTIDVDGDVELRSMKLDKIPIKFGKVTGKFNCSDNKLTSLKGSPREVGGGFFCYGNKLTSLEGGPIKVGRYFNCSDNKLTSLVGAPKEVGGSFYCYDNKLTTLNGGPKEVGGDFDCSRNKLTTLEGGPIKVAANFSCNNNNLTKLEGCPIYSGNFYCYNNKLTSLEGGPNIVGGNLDYWNWNNLETRRVGSYFDYRNNKITNLEVGPIYFGNGDFSCDGNPIFQIFKLFRNEKSFMNSLDYNYIIGKDIDKRRFQEALDEIGMVVPESIPGYRYI